MGVYTDAQSPAAAHSEAIHSKGSSGCKRNSAWRWSPLLGDGGGTIVIFAFACGVGDVVDRVTGQDMVFAASTLQASHGRLMLAIPRVADRWFDQSE